MAEWESAHTAVAELRGIVESHMDTARGEWECVAENERLLFAAKQLQGQVAALTLERDEAYQSFDAQVADTERYSQALADCQRREERLRAALESINKAAEANWDDLNHLWVIDVAREALGR